MRKSYFAKVNQVLLISTLFLFSSLDFFSQSKINSNLELIRSEFNKQMGIQKIVGGSLVVIKGGEILFNENYGLSNIARSEKTDLNTIYCWGSITKTLTCIAIMQLQLRNKINIDDPLVKYIPAFNNVNNPYNNTDSITLKMLMSHSSGLQSSSFIIPLSWHKPWPVWNQLEPVFNYVNIEYQPGTKYRYSNLGLLLLGRVIEVVTKDDYEVYIDKNILKPLKMYSSYFDTTPYHLLKYKAQGYYELKENEERKLFEPDIDQGVTTSNGGLKSSINDFCKYINFLLGTDRNKQNEIYQNILPREILMSMWQPVKPFSDPNNGSIGLGFHIYTELNNKYIGHTGSANGFICQFMINTKSNTAFFMVGNTENSGKVFKHMKQFIDENYISVIK